MQINFRLLSCLNKYGNKRVCQHCLKLKPLIQDVVSFTSKKFKKNDIINYILPTVSDQEAAKEEIERIKQKFGCEPKDCTAEQIFEAVGIKYETDENGFLTLYEYRQPSPNFTFDDLGVDENKLCEKIREIKGKADFFNSKVTNLSNLQSIGKDANFPHSKEYIDLSNLQSIGGNAYFSHSHDTNLSNLQSIAGYADFDYSQIKDLNNLKSIGGNANFAFSNINNLSNLQTIAGYANFYCSQVTNLDKLEYIGRNACFRYSQVTNLDKLEYIGREADFRDSKIKDLPGHISIAGNCYISNSELKKKDLADKVKGKIQQ